MSIEILESRIAPSTLTGPTINLITSGQTLKVTGGSPTDSISVFVGSDPMGGVDVSAGSTTNFLLNGSPVTPVNSVIHLPTVLGTITFIGGTDGGSHVGLTTGSNFGGSVILNLGGTGNSVDVQSQTIGGSLTVNTPGGGTGVTFDAFSATTIGGPVKLLLGTGTNYVSISSPAFNVAGSFSLVGGPAKLPSLVPVGSNLLNVNTGGNFTVAGSVLFNSKNAPGDVSIHGAVNISKSVTIEETTAALLSGSPVDTISGPFLSIGGNLSWTNTGNQGFTLGSGGTSVGGNVILNEGGNGQMKIDGYTTSIGSLTVTSAGHGALLVTPGSNNIRINGGVKLNGLGYVSVQGFGAIGGSFSALNTGDVHLDDSYTLSGTNSPNLTIGGSVIVKTQSAPGTLPQSTYLGNLVVGGSLAVSGQIPGALVSVKDSSIFGSATLEATTVVFTQDQNAPQMLVTGATTIALPTTGDLFIVQNQNTPLPPGMAGNLMFLGKTKIVAPFSAGDTLTYSSTSFALPVAIVSK